MYIIQLLDWYAAAISVIAICFVELLMVAWLYGVDNFARDIGFMTGHHPGWWWRTCWRYVTPTILALLFVTTIAYNTKVSYAGRVYPMWAIVIGWWIAIASLLCIPLYAMFRMAVTDGTWAQCSRVFASGGMRPASEPFRSEYAKMLLDEKTAPPVAWRQKVGDFSEHML